MFLEKIREKADNDQKSIVKDLVFKVIHKMISRPNGDFINIPKQIIDLVEAECDAQEIPVCKATPEILLVAISYYKLLEWEKEYQEKNEEYE